MKAMKFLAVFMVLAMLLTACGQAAATEAPVAATEAPVAATEAPVAGGAPEACADALGCAVFEAGDVIKIGMGAPMTGGNASYGIDISQGATIAMSDAGDIEGWTFALDAQDDGGSAEGGAAVANKFAADPTIVAVAGHIFSGATSAAMPIYEKVGIPMLSPSATLPSLTTLG